MSDTEIYVDSLAEMQIQNLNCFVALMRNKIMTRDQIPDSDHYLRTLKLCEIDESHSFNSEQTAWNEFQQNGSCRSTILYYTYREIFNNISEHAA